MSRKCQFCFMALSALLKPIKVGSITIPNRFIRSPTCELNADKETGMPSKPLFDIIEAYAEGKCGLIIPGYVYVDRKGRGLVGQAGFETDEQANAWKPTVDKCHKKGSKIVFQICHSGINSESTCPLKGPTGLYPNSSSMTIEEIETTIENFRKAAIRAYKIGADGVQIHGAHGYLLSEFLSPAMNFRKDKYGGSDENRMRIVQEITNVIRSSTPKEFIIGIKMNGHDCLDSNGITPQIAAKTVHNLKGIDFFEISCGLHVNSTIRSINTSKTLYNKLNEQQKSIVKSIVQTKIPSFPFYEGYTVSYAEYIKSLNPNKIIASVGGHRTFNEMEKVILRGQADMISMSRPFLREPDLVKKFMEGKIKKVACTSCGECILKSGFHGVAHCYFPKY